MSFQDAYHEEGHRLYGRFIYGGGGYTTSNSHARLISGTSSEVVTLRGQWYGGSSTSIGQGVTIAYTYSGNPAAVAKNEEYNPELVAEILAADALPPEEPGFNNVVDLLEWLNRD